MWNGQFDSSSHVTDTLVPPIQGADSLSQLRKLAQHYPTMESGGDAGEEEEEDEVPGTYVCVCLRACVCKCVLC